jgi:hypothetical protein
MTTKKTKPDQKQPKLDEKLEQPSNRTPQQSRLALKKKVRIFYDLQRLRIQCGGRTLNRAEGAPIILHEVDVAILERRMKELHQAEKNALHDVEDHLKTMPFYEHVLSDKEQFKGIGPTMAGVILSEFDIEREDTPSKMWAFAGLRPMPALRCQECHEVVAEGVIHPKARKARKPGAEEQKIKCKYAGETKFPRYESGVAQRPVSGQKLNYNAWLRTKLVGVLGPILLKVGSPWRRQYDDYKHRKTTAGWGKSDGHRHQAAIRYMVKMLLQDIWRKWREAEGLPVREPYAVEFQSKMPHQGGVHGNGETPRSFEEEPLADEIAAELENLES